MSGLLSFEEFQARLGSDSSLKVIDVRLEEDYLAGHVPGALNNCVFEMVFLGRAEQQGLTRDDVVCVYGAGKDSLESQVAAEKLERAGYQNVFEYRGGFDEWEEREAPVERQASPSNPTSPPDGSRSIDTDESRVEWVGRNLLNKHWGKICLSRGFLEFENGALVGGEFVLDMNAITCDDLAGSDLHDVLVSHLRSDDFFDVERHPEGHFIIIRATPVDGSGPGGQNLHIRGELTLKGITHPVEFTASTGLAPDGRAAAQASFSIDRTQWNILYGSGKWFKRLAGHLVNDEIDLQLRIVTV